MILAIRSSTPPSRPPRAISRTCGRSRRAAGRRCGECGGTGPPRNGTALGRRRRARQAQPRRAAAAGANGRSSSRVGGARWPEAGLGLSRKNNRTGTTIEAGRGGAPWGSPPSSGAGWLGCRGRPPPPARTQRRYACSTIVPHSAMSSVHTSRHARAAQPGKGECGGRQVGGQGRRQRVPVAIARHVSSLHIRTTPPPAHLGRKSSATGMPAPRCKGGVRQEEGRCGKGNEVQQVKVEVKVQGEEGPGLASRIDAWWCQPRQAGEPPPQRGAGHPARLGRARCGAKSALLRGTRRRLAPTHTRTAHTLSTHHSAHTAPHTYTHAHSHTHTWLGSKKKACTARPSGVAKVAGACSPQASGGRAGGRGGVCGTAGRGGRGGESRGCSAAQPGRATRHHHTLPPAPLTTHLWLPQRHALGQHWCLALAVRPGAASFLPRLLLRPHLRGAARRQATHQPFFRHHTTQAPAGVGSPPQPAAHPMHLNPSHAPPTRAARTLRPRAGNPDCKATCKGHPGPDRRKPSSPPLVTPNPRVTSPQLVKP